jgi:hypothetical protein
MPIDEVMASTTPRQLRIWKHYWEQKLNEPTPTDWYVMQVAREVRVLQHIVRSLVKRVNDNIPNLDDFKIRFVRKDSKESTSKTAVTESQKKVVDARKAMLLAQMGFKPEQWQSNNNNG